MQVGNNRYAPIMAGSAGQLIYLTMAYMQMTREQSHTWALDPNQAIAIAIFGAPSLPQQPLPGPI